MGRLIDTSRLQLHPNLVVLAGEPPRLVTVVEGTTKSIDITTARLALAFVDPQSPPTVMRELMDADPGLDERDLRRRFQLLLGWNALVPELRRLSPPRTGLFDGLRLTVAQALQLPPRSVVVAGMPYEAGTTGQPGARTAPHALRLASTEGFTFDDRTLRGCWDPVRDRRMLDGVTFADVGDLAGNVERLNGPAFDRLERVVTWVAGAGHLPVTLGGDHSIALAAIRGAAAAHSKIGVLQFDAHADMTGDIDDDWRVHCDHASFMNWVGADERVSQIVRVGLRQRTREAPSVDAKVLMLTGAGITTQDVLDALPRDLAWYVTVDVDVLDPLVLSGTGAPVPAGLSQARLADMLHAVGRSREIVGFDVCEFAPTSPAAHEALAVCDLILEFVGAATSTDARHE